MKLSKCHFFAKEIHYLGNAFSNNCIKPLPTKIAAIKLMKPSRNATSVRAFLGLVGYYHKFIKNFVWIAKLLTALTHHTVKFAWISGHLTAFNTLKNTLLEAHILHYPDPSKHYLVYTDASGDACRPELLQEHDCQEPPVAFLSHISTDIQQKMSTTDQEAYDFIML